MTQILSFTFGWQIIKHLWMICLVSMLLGNFTTTVPVANYEESPALNSTGMPLTNTTDFVTTHEPDGIGGLIPKPNVTAVTDWIKHNKKKAAIGLIVGVTIAVLIVVLICCCVSRVASAKIKRKKKKKSGVLRGYLKKLKLPKLSMPKLKIFQVQPKGGFGKEIKNIGSLKFSLYYEKRNAELYVNIKRAEDLSLKSSAYVSFNFVQVELDPFSVARSAMGEYYETERVRNSVCPVFNDVITIKILPDELKKQTLICYVFDENRISPRDLVGVASLEIGIVFKQIYGHEKDFHETLKWRKGSKGGDILLSFRWNPKNEIFHVTIKECSNLAAMDGKGQANPYVKIEAFDGTARFFQETTDTKNKTLFPVFNERFHFRLTNQQKKTVSVIISVKHHPKLGGKKVVIGQLSFSFRSIGEELAHWKSALSSGNDVEMMHHLHAAVEMPRKHRLKSRGEELIDVLSEEENLSENEEDRLL